MDSSTADELQRGKTVSRVSGVATAGSMRSSRERHVRPSDQPARARARTTTASQCVRNRSPTDSHGGQYETWRAVGLRARTAGHHQAGVSRPERAHRRLDVDGKFHRREEPGAISRRSQNGTAPAASTGREPHAAVSIPNYVDFANDIHSYHRARAMIERLQTTNARRKRVPLDHAENGTGLMSMAY